MKNSFREQFESLRQIVLTNVSTLKDLIKQSDALSDIIHSLEGKSASDELKKSLSLIKNKIHEAIVTLSYQTNDLFDTYTKMLEEVYKK